MAWDINTVTLVGRLTRDPELAYTASNKPVCKFSLANNRGSNPEDVNFFDVVAWDKTAEICGQNLKKGGQVIVEGRLKMDKWTDKTSGQPRTKVNIVATNVQFIGARQDGAGGTSSSGYEGRSEAPRAAATPRSGTRQAPSSHEPIDFEPLGDDEVPF
jgi:single-strand DNA-binding protein